MTDPTVALRLRLIGHRVAMLRDVLKQDKAATAELAALVEETNSTLIEPASSASSPTGHRPSAWSA